MSHKRLPVKSDEFGRAPRSLALLLDSNTHCLCSQTVDQQDSSIYFYMPMTFLGRETRDQMSMYVYSVRAAALLEAPDNNRKAPVRAHESRTNPETTQNADLNLRPARLQSIDFTGSHRRCGKRYTHGMGLK